MERERPRWFLVRTGVHWKRRDTREQRVTAELCYRGIRHRVSGERTESYADSIWSK
jgi:hypothetical protein